MNTNNTYAPQVTVTVLSVLAVAAAIALGGFAANPLPVTVKALAAPPVAALAYIAVKPQ